MYQSLHEVKKYYYLLFFLYYTALNIFVQDSLDLQILVNS